MKRFYYINENEEEQLDLIALFEYAFDYKVESNDITNALNVLDKYIKIEKNE